MGAYSKAFIVTVPQLMRCQLSYFLMKKPMSKDHLQISTTIHNDRYLEYVDSSAKKLCVRSSSSKVDVASIGSNA